MSVCVIIVISSLSIIVLSLVILCFNSKDRKINKLIRQYEDKNKVKILSIVDQKFGSFSLKVGSLDAFNKGTINRFNDVLKNTSNSLFPVPLVIILHTGGGSATLCQMICNMLMRYPNYITVVVPSFALSAGTIVALCADSLVMDINACLGPIDPQVDSLSSHSILRGLEKASEFWKAPLEIIGDQAEKADIMIKTILEKINKSRVRKGYESYTESFMETISRGKTHSHCTCYDVDDLKNMGLTMTHDIDNELYKIFQALRDK